MENASKALIIAGSVLIAILLISVGIIVMNSINDPIDQATSSAESQAVEMFNSQFTAYAGEQKSAAVKTLMSKAAANTGDRQVSVTKNGVASTVSEIQSKVDSKKSYNISFTYEKGYVSIIDVTGDFN